MKLYDLNEEIELAESALNDWAEEHEGDITDCPFDMILEDLNIDKEEKILGLAAWYKNLNAEAKAIEEEVKLLSARKSAISNKAERLKNFIGASLDIGKKISDSKVALSWRNSQKVLIVCEVKALPIEYQNIKIEASKSELKKALKAGEEIDCVSLEDSHSLQIK